MSLIRTLQVALRRAAFRRFVARAVLAGWVLVGFDVLAQIDSARMRADSIAAFKRDSANQYKADSAAYLETRRQFKIDSTRLATQRAIQLRDTINNPRPLRPEQIRRDRKEHLLAVGGVTAMALLTFLLYNLRTR